MSIEIVNEYVYRKAIYPKINHIDHEQLVQKLLPLVDYYGQDVFKRNKSRLSARTINETIVNMLLNDIDNILANRLAIPKVKRNSFEHYQLIYGNNAVNIYDVRTKKSLQTKENFIKRHGLDKGYRKWNEFHIKIPFQFFIAYF